jgi:hypothetical protein
VTGYDDIPQARYELPPLTTVHHPSRKLGEIAVRRDPRPCPGREASATLPDRVARRSCVSPAAAVSPRCDVVRMRRRMIARNDAARNTARSASSACAEREFVRAASHHGRIAGAILSGTSGDFLDASGVRFFFLLLYPQGSGGGIRPIWYTGAFARRGCLSRQSSRGVIVSGFLSAISGTMPRAAAPCLSFLLAPARGRSRFHRVRG